MIPLSQIFKLIRPAYPTVRGPIRGAKKRNRRKLSASAKRKKRRARRVRHRAVYSIAPLPPKSRREINLQRVLALLGIFLLFAIGTLNQRQEIPPSDTPNQLPWQQFSPNVGLRVNPKRVEELAEQYDGEVSRDAAEPWIKLADLTAEEPRDEQKSVVESQSELYPHLSASENLGLRGLPKIEFPEPRLLTYEQSAAPSLLEPIPILSPEPKSGLRWKRLALIQTGSVGLAVAGFRKFDQYFGGSQRPFRVGNDWSKDHTLHFDELIHFQGSYRIAQGMIGLYRWSGMNATWSECLGAGTAATVMTLLEYVDGRRPKPKQGASYSDFTANLLGVGFALAKIHVKALEDVDLRLSYTSFGDVLHKRTLLQYDRMTHWLTYNMRSQVGVPLNFGIGYGVQNAFKHDVHSEIYLGLGFTPVDILARYAPAAAKPLSWLGIYHLGWQVQIK